MSPNCHESIVESSIELEQEYKMCTGEGIAIFQPTIDVKDVELDMPSASIHCPSYNLDG